MAFTPQNYTFEEVLSSTKMNQIDTNIDEVRRAHKGSSAPASPVAGTRWINDSGTPWILNVYDGTDWIEMGDINASTNIFVPANQAWRCIARGTVTSVDAIEVIDLDLTTYDYLVTLQAISGVDGNNLWLRMSDDNGTTFETSGYHYVNGYLTAGTSTLTVNQSNSAAQIIVAVGAGAGTDNEDIFGEILLQQFLAGVSPGYARAQFKMTYMDTSGNLRESRGAGMLVANEDVDAVQISLSGGGNFGTATGTVHVYRRIKIPTVSEGTIQ